MDVRCERCNARYAVDDGLVDEAGLAVRCSKCGHLFRVHRPVRGFRVRKPGGEVLPLPDAALLQRWVVEGRVAREDEVSSDGGPWIKAENLKDLAPFFAVVERARRVEAGAADDATGPISLGDVAGPRSAHDEPTGGVGLAEAPSESWEVPAGRVSEAAEPAWTAAPPATPVAPGRPPRRGAAPPRRGSPWPWILLLLVVLGAAAGALYIVRPEWLPLEALGLRPPVPVPQGPATSAVPPAATVPAAPDHPQAPPPARPDTTASQVAIPPAAPPSAAAPEAQPAPAAPTPSPPANPPAAAAGAEPARALAATPQPTEPGAATPSPGNATAAPSVPAPPPAPPDASAPLPTAPGTAPPAAPAPPATPAAPNPAAAARASASAVPGMPPPAAAPRTGARSTAAADRRASPVARRSKALLADARRMRDRGNSEAALDLYGQVLRLEPDSADALAGRGLCYLDLSRYEPAEESFKAALQADAQHGGALMGLAETYRYEGRRADAVTYYRRYLAAHPDGDAAAAARKAVQALEESQ